MPNKWAIICPDEAHNTGLWKNWLANDCVAIGWPPSLGFRWHGPKTKDRGFEITRKRAGQMRPGHIVLPYLNDWRFGIPAKIEDLALADADFRHTGHRTDSKEPGFGRRIGVTWLERGAPSRNEVAVVPDKLRKGHPRGMVSHTIEPLDDERYESFMKIIRDTGNWKPYKAEADGERSLVVSEVDTHLEESAEIEHEKAAGFQSNPEIRKAVEKYAMEKARKKLEALGYENFTDTARYECYDYTCKRNGWLHYVEVKGTQTKGKSLILTRNEVEHLNTHRGKSILVLVHSILVKNGKEVSCSGGELCVEQRWKVLPRELTTIQYLWNRPS